MQIVTNPGSNLSSEEVAQYAVHTVPSSIVVDGAKHDTRERLTHARIDAWVRAAHEHPYVLGTSAAELVAIFQKLAQTDGEILSIQSSRKVIGSYTAAVSAGRTLVAMSGYENVRVEVVDTLTTDVGVALCTVLAGEATRAGRTIGQTAELVTRFAEQGVTAYVPATLDNLVKGGRAGFLRAWVANLLDVSPIITFVDGEVSAAGRTPRAGDTAKAIADVVVSRIGAGRPVWCGVAHGSAEGKAERLLEELRRRFDVVHAIVRPLSASTYLHLGAGAVGASVHPVDRLPFPAPSPSKWATGPRSPPPR